MEGRRLADEARKLLPPESVADDDPTAPQQWLSNLTTWLGERSAAARRAEEAYLDASQSQPVAVRDTALKEAAQLWLETDRIAREATEKAVGTGVSKELASRVAARITRKGREHARELLSLCSPDNAACHAILENLGPEPTFKKE